MVVGRIRNPSLSDSAYRGPRQRPTQLLLTFVRRHDSPSRLAMRLILPTFVAAIGTLVATPAVAATDEATAFFESRIRPVLVEHCYKCHSGRRSRPRAACAWIAAKPCCGAVRAGRRSCAASPTTACSSRRSATKATSPRCRRTRNCRIAVLADFRRWIASGAPDPRKESPAVTTAGRR